MIFIFQFGYQLSFAQEFPKLFFRTINEKNGLSSNAVSDIKEDKDGFMWIATGDGLNKYDGEKFTIYRKGDKRINILDNSINKIHIDSSQNLWLNYYNGISKTNLINNEDNFEIGELSDVKMAWKNDKVYISERKGIYEIDSKGNAQKLSGLIEPKKYYSTIYNRLLDIYFHKNEIYGNLPNALFKLNDRFDIVKEYKLPKDINILNLFFTNNFCLICSWNFDIYKLDLDSGAFEKLDVINGQGEKYIIRNIISWKQNGKEYLIASASNYLIFIDTKTYRAYRYEVKGEVLNAFVDRKNNLWLSSTIGIQFASNIQETFEVTTIENPTEMPFGSYNHHVEKIESQYWLSTRYNTGFYQLDEEKKIIKHYGKNIWIKPNEFGGLAEYLDAYDFIKYKNKIVCSNDYGMFEIDPISQKTVFIKLDSFDIKLRNIIPKNEAQWFVRSVNKGVFLYNPQQRKFEKLYKVVDENNQPLTLFYMYQDSRNDIYVSSHFGLYKYHIQQDSFVKIKNNPIENWIVYQIAEDKENKLWIATYMGVYVYNAQRTQIKPVLALNEKVSKAEFIKVDDNNNIWLNNDQGIHYYNQATKSIKSLNADLELFQTTDYTILGSFDGKMYAGADNHILKIDIEKFEKYNENSTLHLTSVLVNNIEKLTSKSETKFELNPDEQNIKISFSALSYNASKSIQYMFRYIDSDSTWTMLNEGELYLPNLNYGEYHIQIKGINKITNQYTSTKDVYFNVNYPWYLTPWFKVIIGFLLASLLFLLYKFRSNQIRKKARLEKQYHEMITGLEMKNLRSQMNPHFLFNALNSINKFVVQNQTKEASDYLSKFSRLMRLILENSQKELISLASEIESLELYLLIEANRFDNGFKYTILKDRFIDSEEIMIPPLIIQPFVENAIWHGIRHSNKQGNIIIEIDLDEIKNAVSIKIIDNGIGRKMAAQLKSKSSISEKSFGIKISNQRLKNLNPLNDIEIMDLIDDKGSPTGTQINITYFINDL